MIRKLELKDKENWSKLYNGYADFYKVPMNKGTLDTLWGWIQDVTHDVNGICFELEGNIVSYLKSLSKANNWDGVRWITHSSNENAKKLYDKIANNTGFELYELKGN